MNPKDEKPKDEKPTADTAITPRDLTHDELERTKGGMGGEEGGELGDVGDVGGVGEAVDSPLMSPVVNDL